MSSRSLSTARLLVALVFIAASGVAGRAVWTMARGSAAFATSYVPDGRPPEGLRARLAGEYDQIKGRLLLRRLGQEIRARAGTDRERVEAALQWTYLHVRPASVAAPERLVWDDPYRTIKRGFGYCDQSAQVFCLLADRAGVRARLYFLRNAEGESPHTVAQAFVDGEWILVDSLAGRVLVANGEPMTVDRLQREPALLTAAYEGSPDHFHVTADDFARGYLPFGDRQPPWHQGPEVPLPALRPSVDQPRSVLLYDDFREAVLDGDSTSADRLYAQLSELSLPRELQESLGYHATLAAYEAGHWTTAVRRVDTALAKDPTSPWQRSLYELRGLANERLGALDDALADYAHAGLPSTVIRAQRLRSEKGTRTTVTH